ncbi:MAG: hypothetical protein Edafosvirus3_20 [Edafosvirus sp.]|uniref:Uncharacterized protein n=1 Tax=Edafosvirus sp. TaxID=2487765 RepID=A0A3G4ZSQ5_9VIRU|nr:MAG: hypothetical protein Edafosvirus3_20 [Edafosvirus sp.]
MDFSIFYPEKLKKKCNNKRFQLIENKIINQMDNYTSRQPCPVCKQTMDYDNNLLYTHLTEGKCSIVCKHAPLMNNKIRFTNHPTIITENGLYVMIIYPNAKDRTIDICAFSNNNLMKNKIIEIYYDNNNGCVKIPIIMNWNSDYVQSLGYISYKSLKGKSEIEMQMVLVDKQEFILNNWIMHNKYNEIGIETSFNNRKIYIHNMKDTLSKTDNLPNISDTVLFGNEPKQYFGSTLMSEQNVPSPYQFKFP